MLTHLRIDRFGCCRQTSIDLGTQLVALVGRNGAGKTTILRSIEWVASTALGLEEASTTRVMADNAATLAFCLNKKVEYQYTVKRDAFPSDTFSPSTAYRELLTTGSNKRKLFERTDDVVSSPLRPELIRIGKAATGLAAIAALLPADDALAEAAAPIARYLSQIAYYDLGIPTGTHDFVPLSLYQKWVREYRETNRAPDSIACRLIYMHEHASDLFDELLMLLGRNGLGLIEGIDIVRVPGDMPSAAAAEAATDETRIYFPMFTLTPMLGGAGTPLPWSALSAGTQRMLRLIACLLFDEQRVFLLEQPEDCVHAGLLYKLIDILRSYSRRSQIIFATHSLEVLNALRPEEVRLVKAAKRGTTCRRLNPHELRLAQSYLEESGSLGEFVESIQEE